MPKVSVIIPNYNHARFLPQRVESVLNQTYQDFELIILDDASSDDSVQVIQRLIAAEPRARLIANDANSGSTFKQWNKGVALAAGEYIWLAESDDAADPWLLERLMTLLDADQNVTVAWCQSKIIDEQDQEIGTALEFAAEEGREMWQADFIADGVELCSAAMILRNAIPNASAALFRREAFLRAGGAEANWKIGGDWKLWTDLLMLDGRSKGAFVAEPLNYFRRHVASVRDTAARSGLSLLETAQAMAHVVKSVAKVAPERIDRARLDAAAARLADSWGYYAQRGEIEPATAAAFAEVMRRLDPKAGRRLATARVRHGWRSVSSDVKNGVKNGVRRLLERP